MVLQLQEQIKLLLIVNVFKYIAPSKAPAAISVTLLGIIYEVPILRGGYLYNMVELLLNNTPSAAVNRGSPIVAFTIILVNDVIPE